MKLWDVRMVAEKGELNAGAHPLNQVAFDLSGSVLLAASDDGTVKVFDTEAGALASSLRGHEDSVQAVVVDPGGEFVVTGGSDCSFRVWS